MQVIIDRHTPCWVWQGRTYKGRAWWDGNRLAYREVWRRLIGAPPSGLVAHHVCENPACVSPWHIEWLDKPTHAREHQLGGGDHQVIKTKCPQGHKYTPENTHYTKHGHRKCRQCNRDRARERRHPTCSATS